MTYLVSSETLNLNSINQSINIETLQKVEMFTAWNCDEINQILAVCALTGSGTDRQVQT